MYGINYTNMSNFQPLEVVGRGRETQLQEGENLNYLIYEGNVCLNINIFKCLVLNFTHISSSSSSRLIISKKWEIVKRLRSRFHDNHPYL